MRGRFLDVRAGPFSPAFPEGIGGVGPASVTREFWGQKLRGNGGQGGQRPPSGPEMASQWARNGKGIGGVGPASVTQELIGGFGPASVTPPPPVN